MDRGAWRVTVHRLQRVEQTEVTGHRIRFAPEKHFSLRPDLAQAAPCRLPSSLDPASSPTSCSFPFLTCFRLPHGPESLLSLPSHGVLIAKILGHGRLLPTKRLALFTGGDD